MQGKKALILSSSGETINSLVRIAEQAGFDDTAVSDGRDIRDIPPDKYYVILSSLPFEDVFGLDRVTYINKFFSACQVVFVPSKVYEEVCGKLGGRGIMLLPRSVSEAAAVNAVRSVCALREQLDELREENAALRRSLDETKLVNRAKCVLIEYLRITEKDAHRQIQKRAMDHRITLSEAAAEVLKTYEYMRSDN